MNKTAFSFLRHAGLSLAITVTLSACASVGDYRAAPISVAGQYGRGDASINAPSQPLETQATYPARNIGDDAWWRGFGDERLDRMVTQALQVNANLASAGLTLRQARLQAGLAETDLWPSVTGSVSSSGSRQLDTHDSVQRSSSASVSLSWEIDLWGRLRAERDVATWEAKATAEDRENTALALVGEVCQQYWTLAYLNQSIVAGQANLDYLQQALALVRVQFDAGNVSRLEVREAEQNVESERTAQSQLVQQRVEVRNAITVLLDGTPWPQADEPQDLATSRSPVLAEGVPAEVLGRRPDLRAAELRLRESLASIKATARSYYPAFSLTGSVSGSSTSLSDVVKNPVGALGAGLTLPFLNVRQAQLNTEIAGTSYEIAASDFRTTLYTALSEVDNALSSREQLAQQADSARKSFEAAQDVARMYQVRYQVGATDLRTWLDAQQTLRTSELSLAQVRLNQLVADVTLYQALGGSDAAAVPPAS
ncbi:efflux transporter outer membrane subunit [Pseudoxanthomonas sp.]|uniref:efflux transporter outer membrane subunit n=1 Tax=Pseudoxanthomonas sp. TaxID=1871049 RepID=UPI00262A3A34|nr:efflux transporter outer membrane subunit [Pseudoxanthomonas sp.]WDS35459.1 MAG: efflux transporter outer membrane subunit [Pseudoxanthomonas sp.]